MWKQLWTIFDLIRIIEIYWRLGLLVDKDRVWSTGDVWAAYGCPWLYMRTVELTCSIESNPKTPLLPICCSCLQNYSTEQLRTKRTTHIFLYKKLDWAVISESRRFCFSNAKTMYSKPKHCTEMSQQHPKCSSVIACIKIQFPHKHKFIPKTISIYIVYWPSEMCVDKEDIEWNQVSKYFHLFLNSNRMFSNVCFLFILKETAKPKVKVQYFISSKHCIESIGDNDYHFCFYYVMCEYY